MTKFLNYAIPIIIALAVFKFFKSREDMKFKPNEINKTTIQPHPSNKTKTPAISSKLQKKNKKVYKDLKKKVPQNPIDHEKLNKQYSVIKKIEQPKDKHDYEDNMNRDKALWEKKTVNSQIENSHNKNKPSELGTEEERENYLKNLKELNQ